MIEFFYKEKINQNIRKRYSDTGDNTVYDRTKKNL